MDKTWFSEGLPPENTPCIIIPRGWHIPYPRWAFICNGKWLVLDDSNDGEELPPWCIVEFWMPIPERDGKWFREHKGNG